jgi:hypothetical protein
MFIVATLAATEAKGVQEPPFARPVHPEVVPLVRQPLPHGRVEFLPRDDRPLVRLGMSAPTVALNVPLGIEGQIILPENEPLTTRDEVVLRLTVTKPAGCYRTDADVKTIDGFRHLVTVELFGAADEPCLTSKTVEAVDVAMGRLAAGEHTILIGDGVKASTTVTVRVNAPDAGLAE